MTRRCVLFVDDETTLLRGWQRAVRDLCVVRTAATYEDAWRILQEHTVHVAVVDVKLNGRTGVDLLERMRSSHPRTVRALITAGEIEPDHVTRARPRFAVHKPDIGMRDAVRKLVQEALDEVDRLTDDHPAVPPAAPTWEQQSTPTVKLDASAPLTEERAKQMPLTAGLLIALVLMVGGAIAAWLVLEGRIDAKDSKAVAGHESKSFRRAHEDGARRLDDLQKFVKEAIDKQRSETRTAIEAQNAAVGKQLDEFKRWLRLALRRRR